MKTLDADLMQAIVGLELPDAWIVLLDVDCGSGTHVRLANNTEDVAYDGNTYLAAPFEPEAVRLGKGGPHSHYALRLTNLADRFVDYLRQSGGLEGQDLTVTLVCTSDLAADYSDFQTTYTIKGHDEDDRVVTFEIGHPNLYLARFPRRRYLANVCEVQFKGALCGYSGGESSCDHTLSRCRELSNETRFGGSPGLRNKTLRVIV